MTSIHIHNYTWIVHGELNIYMDTITEESPSESLGREEKMDGVLLLHSNASLASI